LRYGTTLTAVDKGVKSPRFGHSKKDGLTIEARDPTYLLPVRPRRCLIQPMRPAVFAQLRELRGILGDVVTAELIGITRQGLTWRRQGKPTWRAVQYLHALVTRQGRTVALVDILTSFRYCPRLTGPVTGQAPQLPSSGPRTPQADPSCGVEIVVGGDGDGI